MFQKKVIVLVKTWTPPQKKQNPQTQSSSEELNEIQCSTELGSSLVVPSKKMGFIIRKNGKPSMS